MPPASLAPSTGLLSSVTAIKVCWLALIIRKIGGLSRGKCYTFFMGYAFTFTPEIVRLLQRIERARTEVGLLILPPALAESLRTRARLRSTHFSTKIEGNRLSLAEAEQVILAGRNYRGRERDALEIKHYYQALAQVEAWVDSGAPISAEHICKLHAMIYTGKRARPTPYRDGQNVIRDSAGRLVYLPPEAKDVPQLMGELVGWLETNENEYPAPVLAGVAHYQFVTIHPFFDGNGRTARSLATWILYRSGYDLGKFYALEEFYALDLPGYYAALETHPHHNYYEGRASADITAWLVYFLTGMAAVFETVAGEVRQHAAGQNPEQEALLRKLDRRGRIVLGIFAGQDEITSTDVSGVLGLSGRQARDLLAEWVAAGWLEASSTARKTRRYRLAAQYRRFIGGITAE